MSSGRLTNGNNEIYRGKVWFIGYHHCHGDKAEVEQNFDGPKLTIGGGMTIGDYRRHQKE